MSWQFIADGDFLHVTIFSKERYLCFALVLMYFKVMQYIFDNKKAQGSSPTQGREGISPGTAREV